MTSRRDLLILGAAVAGAYSLAWWLQRPTFDFYEMQEPKGFRRLSLGAISQSSQSSIFAGLDAPAETTATFIREDLICGALFTKRATKDQVRIASFSDYNCPYCRILSRELLEMASTEDISVSWHELPLLGPSSIASARLALAASRQGAYVEVHRRLMAGRFVPTPGFTAAIAQEFQLDASRLEADQTSDWVEKHFTNSKSLAATFGIVGTPALVVGRTLVIGNISPRQLAELIAIERKDGPSHCL